MGRAADEVIGMLQRLVGQRLDVIVLHRVEDLVAVAPGSNETSKPQLREVLRDRRRPHPDVVSELVHGMLAMKQRPDDPQSGRIRQHLQHRRGRTDRAADGSVQSAVWAARRAYDSADWLAGRVLQGSAFTPDMEKAILSHPVVQTELKRQWRDIGALIAAGEDASQLVQVLERSAKEQLKR